MKSKELIQRARDGEVVGDGSAQINALLYAYDSALNGQEFTHQWYAVRMERLRTLIHDDALHIEDEFFNIVANGTASAQEPPKHDQILNGLRHQNVELRGQLEEAEQTIESLRNDIRYLDEQAGKAIEMESDEAARGAYLDGLHDGRMEAMDG